MARIGDYNVLNSLSGNEIFLFAYPLGTIGADPADTCTPITLGQFILANQGLINSASNIGNAGQGLFDQQVSNQLQFYNIAPASNKISVALDSPNNNVIVDLIPANVNINSLGGLLTSLGIVTVGTWNASPIADLYIATPYIKADGTRGLSGNWNAGSFSATFNNVIIGSAANTISGLSTIINSGTLTLPTSTDTLIAKATTDTLTNKTYDTAGTGNIFKINGVSITGVTGSGLVVLQNSPTLITPILGVASGTSLTINGTSGNGFLELDVQSVNPSSGATNSVRLFSNSAGLLSWIKPSDGFVRSFSSTLSSDRVYTFPDQSGTFTLLGNSTTGSGGIVLANSPSLITPNIGAATGTSLLVNGTAGNGYVELDTQSSAPAIGAVNSVRLFSNNSGHLAWKKQIDGFVRAFVSVLTADRNYTLPDLSSNIVATASTPTDGQIPIGSTSTGFYSAANITPGTHATVTNSPGAITINSTLQINQIYQAGIAFASTTTYTQNSGRLRDSTDTVDIILGSNQTINMGASGAVNQLDTGTFAANTWYATFVISSADGTTLVGGLASLSQSSPNLPTGYSKFRRTGWIRSQPGSALIINFVQNVFNQLREYVWVDIISNLTVLTNGNATTYTGVSLAAVIPPTAQEGILNSSFTSAAQTDGFAFRPTGNTTITTIANSNNRYFRGSGTTNPTTTLVNIVTNTSQSVDYIVTAAGDALTLSGFSWKEGI